MSRLKSQIADAEEILAGGDAELAELAEVELTEAKNALPDVEHELQILLLPHDPNDDKNVISEIRRRRRRGRGGAFCVCFVQNVYDVCRQSWL